MCLYIRTHVHIYTHSYTCRHTHTHTQTLARSHSLTHPGHATEEVAFPRRRRLARDSSLCVCVCVCVCVCMRVCAHRCRLCKRHQTYVCACVCVCARARMCVLIHTHAHTKTHLPVGLVDEHGTKVANNVDDPEHEPALGVHRQKLPVLVAIYRCLCVCVCVYVCV